MRDLSFTSSEWDAFLDGFDEPEDGYRVADQLWNRERKAKLKEYREFVAHCQVPGKEKEEAEDLLAAAFSLYAGNTKVYREVMDKLTRWVYDHGYEPIIYESDLLPGT